MIESLVLQVFSDPTFPFAKALAEKKQLVAVFLKYSKAFDSVSFNCLLRELYVVGIRGNLLSWFRSYSTDHLHLTVIDMVRHLLCYQFHPVVYPGIIAGYNIIYRFRPA